MSVALSAVRGAIWNVATSVGARIATLVGTLVLTHLIAPKDMGEVAAASICCLTAMMFVQLRHGNYLIAKNGTQEEAFNANVVHIGIAIPATIFVIVFRDPLAVWVNSPNMGKYVPGLAVAGFIERFAYIPERLLTRELKFRPVAVARSLGEIGYIGASLAFAPMMGGMAIVVGNLVRAVLLTGLTMRASTWAEYGRRAPLRWATIGRMTKYSLPGALAGIFEIASLRWDNLLVSRYFGPSQHGLYSLAYNLGDTPTGAVGEQVADVLFPSFAKLEPERREPALRRAMALLGVVIFPLAVGLGSVAPTVVQAFFDERWQGVAPMLEILAVLSIAKTMAFPLVGFMQANHHQRPIMVLSFLKVGILFGTIALFAPHGPLWTCVGVGATYLIDTYLCMLFVRVLDGIRILPILIGLLPVVLSSATMAAGVYGTRVGLERAGMHPGVLLLILEVTAGAIVYVVASLVFARSLSMDLLNQLKNVIRRRRASSS